MGARALLFKGILWLSLAPILVVVFALVSFRLLPLFRIFVLPLTTVIPIILYTFVIYIFLLSLKVPYADLDILDSVRIPQAPKEISSLLKKTTRGTNRLINVELISVLGKKPLIQSRIVERTQKRGINLSSTQIIGYLSELETKSIIHSKKGTYEREYSLTKKGKWCYEAVKECFPKRQFWFIIRHYLGVRKLPPFPKVIED